MTKMGNERIGELLVETGAYRDLDKPVILASGQLGIFYINTEKLCQDDGKFKEFGDDSAGMIAHAQQMAVEHPTFQEVIEILKGQANDAFGKLITSMVHYSMRKYGEFQQAISGGQRRDWIFSGPVAQQLDMPHISLYKEGQFEVVYPDGRVEHPENLGQFYAVHIVDLLTEGSSANNSQNGKSTGWIPMLRDNEAGVRDLIAVVDRLQGGQDNLFKVGVDLTRNVIIDDAFLKQLSSDPDRALAYTATPEAPDEWSKTYLREHGALAFVSVFDPAGEPNLVKAKRFMDRYRGTLQEAGKLQEFEQKVQDTYGKPLDQILGGD